MEDDDLSVVPGTLITISSGELDGLGGIVLTRDERIEEERWWVFIPGFSLRRSSFRRSSFVVDDSQPFDGPEGALSRLKTVFLKGKDPMEELLPASDEHDPGIFVNKRDLVCPIWSFNGLNRDYAQKDLNSFQEFVKSLQFQQVLGEESAEFHQHVGQTAIDSQQQGPIFRSFRIIPGPSSDTNMASGSDVWIHGTLHPVLLIEYLSQFNSPEVLGSSSFSLSHLAIPFLPMVTTGHFQHTKVPIVDCDGELFTRFMQNFGSSRLARVFRPAFPLLVRWVRREMIVNAPYLAVSVSVLVLQLAACRTIEFGGMDSSYHSLPTDSPEESVRNLLDLLEQTYHNGSNVTRNLALILLWQEIHCEIKEGNVLRCSELLKACRNSIEELFSRTESLSLGLEPSFLGPLVQNPNNVLLVEEAINGPIHLFPTLRGSWVIGANENRESFLPCEFMPESTLAPLKDFVFNVYITHRWGSELHPDPDNQQLHDLAELVKDLSDYFELDPSLIGIWYDFACFPQLSANSSLQGKCLGSIFNIQCFCDLTVKVGDRPHDLDFATRGWCIAESVLSIIRGEFVEHHEYIRHIMRTRKTQKGLFRQNFEHVAASKRARWSVNQLNVLLMRSYAAILLQPHTIWNLADSWKCIKFTVTCQSDISFVQEEHIVRSKTQSCRHSPLFSNERTASDWALVQQRLQTRPLDEGIPYHSRILPPKEDLFDEFARAFKGVYRDYPDGDLPKVDFMIAHFFSGCDDSSQVVDMIEACRKMTINYENEKIVRRQVCPRPYEAIQIHLLASDEEWLREILKMSTGQPDHGLFQWS